MPTTSKKHSVRKIIWIVSAVVAVLAIVFFVYFGIYYHADETAGTALNGTDTVTVTKIDGGYFFDGPAEDTAFIFYPGAKVEATAYAPLMLKLAEAGIDCFLAEMPFRFALFNGNIADEFINAYDYDRWILGGHSLGGVSASIYVSEHTDTVDGLVLLASYSTKEIDDDITVLSVYGSNDGCLNQTQYEENKKNLPDDTVEYVIDGGNHAGFGNYGLQKGDGTASLSAEEQQQITAKFLIELFSK